MKLVYVAVEGSATPLTCLPMPRAGMRSVLVERRRRCPEEAGKADCNGAVGCMRRNSVHVGPLVKRAYLSSEGRPWPTGIMRDSIVNSIGLKRSSPSPLRVLSVGSGGPRPGGFASAAILLIIGGLLSFLPILGLWMVPLGALLLAQDIPFLRRPVGRALVWLQRQWIKWKRRSGG
jgi:hypothetical protein